MVGKHEVFGLIERFKSLFPRGIEPEVAVVYWEYLGAKLEGEQFESSLKQAVIQGKSNPSPEWLLQTARTAHAENQAAYGIISGSKALPAAPEIEMDLTQAHFARTQVLAAIFKHQGDSGFYRSMLASNTGVYGRVLDIATGRKNSVAHADVMEYLGGGPSHVQTHSAGQNSGLTGASSGQFGRDDGFAGARAVVADIDDEWEEID